MTNNLWSAYFDDPNVNFPGKPYLIKSIDTYHSPSGLGIIFKGGIEKFIIKGKHVYRYFDFLKQYLNGDFSLDEILKISDDNGFHLDEMATLIKILHSYHVIIEFEKVTTVKRENAYNTNSINFYERIIGLTGNNKYPTGIIERLRKSKILFITSSKIIPCLYHNIKLNGFGEIGFLYIESSEHYSQELTYIKEDVSVLHFEKITNNSHSDLKSILSKSIDNYTHLCFAMLESNLTFIQEVTQICALKGRNLLFFNEFDHEFEIGPYYFHGDTSCYNCFHLRKQSFNDNTYIDYIYHSNRNENINLNINGYEVASLNIAINYLVLELKKIITNFAKPATINNVLLFNPLTFTTEKISVERVPGCPICNFS